MSTPSTKTPAYYLVKNVFEDILSKPFTFHVNADAKVDITPEFIKQVQINTLRGSLEMSYLSNCGITEDEYNELCLWIQEVTK